MLVPIAVPVPVPTPVPMLCLRPFVPVPYLLMGEVNCT